MKDYLGGEADVEHKESKLFYTQKLLQQVTESAGNRIPGAFSNPFSWNKSANYIVTTAVGRKTCSGDSHYK